MAIDPTEALAGPNTTVDVNTTAPDPVKTIDGNTGQLIPNAPDPAQPSIVTNPNNGIDLDHQMNAHHGFLYNVIDKIGSALGGDKSFDVAVNPDGKLNVTPRKSSMGEKWGRAGIAALQGMSAGLSAPSGPGVLSRSTGLALRAGMAGGAGRQAAQVERAQDDFSNMEKTQVHNANVALLHQRLLESQFGLNRDKADFIQKQDDRQNGIANALMDGNAEEVGTVKDPSDLPKLANSDPNLIQHHMGQGGSALHMEHTFDADGNNTGTRIIRYNQEWGQQKNEKPVTLYRPGRDPNAPIGSKPIMVKEEIPAGAMSHADISKAQMSYDAQANELGLKFNKDAREAAQETSEEGLRKAQGANQYAEAGKNRAEAAAASPGDPNGGTSMAQQAQMMVEGRLAPSQLSKRAKTYNELLPLANQYSMQKYGKPFDAETSETRYKTRQKTTEAYATGTEGNQVTSLNQFLGHTENLMNTVGQLRATNSPLLNMPIKALRKAMGDARYAEIEPQIAAVRTEHANFLNNNHALHAEDIRDNGEMMNDNMSLAQLEGAAKGFAHTAVVRGGALNDKHRRIMGEDVPDMLNDTSKRVIRNIGLDASGRQFLGGAYSDGRAPQSAPQSAGKPTPPQGATAEVHDQGGRLIGYAVNGHYQPLQ